MSKMAIWSGTWKGLPPNISVCHMINICDKIAILFLHILLILFIHENFQDGHLEVLLTKKDPPSISIRHEINISDRITTCFFICSLIIFNHKFEKNVCNLRGSCENVKDVHHRRRLEFFVEHLRWSKFYTRFTMWHTTLKSHKILI